MTIKSIAELLAQADTTLANNTTQAIGADDVRNMIKDFLDTISPAYGAITLASLGKTLSTTPSAITPFSSTVQATANYYAASLANGRITRYIATAGIAGATDFIIASGAVSGANNANVLVELYKGGVATGFKASVTCSGGTDAQGFNIAGISYNAGADVDYDVRVSGPAGSYTFTNVSLVCQAQPVRSFT